MICRIAIIAFIPFIGVDFTRYVKSKKSKCTARSVPNEDIIGGVRKEDKREKKLHRTYGVRR